MNKQLTFSFDVNRCTGCMACVVACQDQNDWKAEHTNFRTVVSYEKGPYPANLACLSLSCMHCGDAPCLMACPTGALFRHEQTGIVDVDRDLCIGCRSCALACPFGAPKFSTDGKMAKCDLCYARIEHGMMPACVHTCTTGALQFGDVNNLCNNKSNVTAVKIISATGLFER